MEAAREINKRIMALHGKRLSEQLDAIKTWQALSNSNLWDDSRGAPDSHFRDPQASNLSVEIESVSGVEFSGTP